MLRGSLKAPAPSEEQIDQDDQQDEAEASTAVVAYAGAHIVATAADQKNHNDQNQD